MGSLIERKKKVMMGMASEKKWTASEIAYEDYVNGETVSQIGGDIVIDVPVIRAYAFYGCGVTSAKITAHKNISGWTLKDRAFSFCHQLEDVLYNPPSNGIGGIGAYAFWDCTKLKRVRITGNVTYINSSSPFGSCPLLTDIYVPWAEGAISGAPWGATNATIHYNTVFDSDGNVIS